MSELHQRKSTAKSPAVTPRTSKSPATTPRVNGHASVAAKLSKNKVEKVSWLWPILSVLCMTVVPFVVYWSWYCLDVKDNDGKYGKLYLPSELSAAATKEWFNNIINKAAEGAMPGWKHWQVYLLWNLFQAILFHYGPGPVGTGSTLADGTKLKYKFNGQFAWFVTLVTAFLLHQFDIFPITFLCDEFAPMLTVCLIFTSAVILVLYIAAALFDGFDRPTDSHIYDYFMGPILNPRIGTFDIKFFFELRPGIMHWFFTTVAFAVKHYQATMGAPDKQGDFSYAMLLIVFYHLCFVNACYKGEACVPHTIDIFYEKFGWMLAMLDLVMVPFIFPMQAFYIYKTQYDNSTLTNIIFLSIHLFAYWMFDTANSQKDYFRCPEVAEMTGFPRLPWGKLNKANYMKVTKVDGKESKLLLDGWWAWARHMNYTGDIIMSWVWGFTCGCGSYFPFTYTTYLTPLLLHREIRDDRDCAAKYGADWEKYKAKVPYRLIPYIY